MYIVAFQAPWRGKTIAEVTFRAKLGRFFVNWYMRLILLGSQTTNRARNIRKAT
jgi:hypothetical protein